MSYKNFIDKFLKQKSPFLFIDDVLNLDDKKIVSTFRLSKEEPILQGHFLGEPVLPGVIMIEMLSQTALFLMVYNFYKKIQKEDIIYDAFLSKVNYFSYKNVVIPDSLIKIEVNINETLLENFYQAKGKILVDEKIKGFGEVTLYFKGKQNG